MTFFESLLALLLAAIVLLQLSRRLSLPYPAMLAAAGVVVALIPGSPTIRIDPQLALALFIAPALVDAAFDFPLGAARRLWQPLVALAVMAVLVTASLVAWVGWAYAGLPIAAAVALGAIVAPPDAAAATAVLSNVSIPRNSDAVLKGESLFNDATALLLFSAALAVQAGGGLDRAMAVELTLAAPGGLLFGIGVGLGVRWINRFVTGTLGGNILQFVMAFLVWIVAEHLHLSAVLATVAMAMTLARSTGIRTSPRMRVHSYAVWATVVFLLNVLAFLLMGMQARIIVGRMAPERLEQAGWFALIVVAVVVVTRLVVVLAFNRFTALRSRRAGEEEPASAAQGVLVGWAGMRGLLTLATSFALPADFPQRDLILLTAFAVVLATLVLQGITLGPLIKWLGLDQGDAFRAEIGHARAKLAQAALDTLEGEDSKEAHVLRHLYEGEKQAATSDGEGTTPDDRRRELGLAAVQAQRDLLDRLRQGHEIGARTYDELLEDIDFRELTLLPEDDRRIEES